MQQAVRQLLTTDPLQLYPDKLPKLPSFAEPAALPPLLTRERAALPSEAVSEVLVMLAFCPLHEPYAGVETLRAELDRESLEEFCWALAEAWLLAGASSKEVWAFQSLAHFGGDETARRLTPLVRKWPGESAHARAVLGLEVLGAIGTDVALMHLHGIAQKLKFKALQTKAREKIGEIAQRRGLSRDQLADRLVPDVGLDSRAELGLDFGARQFLVRLDEQLRPQLWFEGKLLKSLPKPNQKDDEKLAKEAAKRWKALKKDLKQVARGQVLRLERAMTFRRRWRVEDFLTLLVAESLVFPLTRRLVWASYARDQMVETFRVAEDQTLADQKDDELKLSQELTVGLPHPLELQAEERQAWQRVLEDYELVQPFPQLDRPVSRVDDQGHRRIEGRKVPFSAVLALEDRGWERSEDGDGGIVFSFEKIVPGGSVVLSFEPGLYLGALRESGEQTLDKVGYISPQYQELSFQSLDPILYSEIVYDLEAIG